MDPNLYRAPIFKRIDDPWIALLVLAAFMFVSSIVALIILCCFWRRHKQRTRLYNQSFILSNKPTGRKQVEDQQPATYETQVLLEKELSYIFLYFLFWIERASIFFFER